MSDYFHPHCLWREISLVGHQRIIVCTDAVISDGRPMAKQISWKNNLFPNIALSICLDRSFQNITIYIVIISSFYEWWSRLLWLLAFPFSLTFSDLYSLFSYYYYLLVDVFKVFSNKNNVIYLQRWYSEEVAKIIEILTKKLQFISCD